MNPNYVALNADIHKNKKIKEITNFEHARNFHIASITMDEFGMASTSYPIVFLRNEDKSISAATILGLEPDQNLFIDEAGQWTVSYIPSIVRRYPFSLVRTSPESEDMALCVNDDKALINDKFGIDLFKADGSPSTQVLKVQQFLAHIHNMQYRSKEFFQLLDNIGLFTDKALEFQQDGETKSIGGFMVIDYEKLRSLSDEDFIKLRKVDSGLECIHIHLGSLNQMQNLVRLNNMQKAK